MAWVINHSGIASSDALFGLDSVVNDGEALQDGLKFVFVQSRFNGGEETDGRRRLWKQRLAAKLLPHPENGKRATIHFRWGEPKWNFGNMRSLSS